MLLNGANQGFAQRRRPLAQRERSRAQRGRRFAQERRGHAGNDGISKNKTADVISPIDAGGVLCGFFYLRVVTESERLLLGLLFGGEVFFGFADQVEAARDTDQVFLGYCSICNRQRLFQRIGDAGGLGHVLAAGGTVMMLEKKIDRGIEFLQARGANAILQAGIGGIQRLHMIADRYIGEMLVDKGLDRIVLDGEKNV